jgi:hypothetical protein
MPEVPLVVYVEPGPMVLRCYAGAAGASVLLLTISGREIPLPIS